MPTISYEYINVSLISSYSTASNCAAPVNPPPPNDVDEETEQAVQQYDQQADQTTEKGTKRKTKTQNERDNNIEKILKMAQAEDHPVELALLAISRQMIRSLSSDEQDDLLEQIQAVSSAFFREHHKRLKRNVQEPVQSAVAVVPGPPPLTPAGQPVGQPAVPVQQLQQAEIQQIGNDVLVEVGGLPPMDQYSVQYVTAPDTGATYMKLN